MTPFQNYYCLDCNWTASSEDYGLEELTDLITKHSTEYGHSVDTLPE